MARADLRGAERFLRLVLLHLLKLTSAPASFPTDHWRAELAVFQADFATLATRSILRKIEAGKVWRLALGQAAAQLTRQGDAILPNLPQHSPFAPEEISAASFDVDAALHGIRQLSAA